MLFDPRCQPFHDYSGGSGIIRVLADIAWSVPTQVTQKSRQMIP
jgi:hypothetical protein